MNIFELTTEIATANTDLFATEEEIEQKLEVLFYELGKKKMDYGLGLKRLKLI